MYLIDIFSHSFAPTPKSMHPVKAVRVCLLFFSEETYLVGLHQ